MVLKHTSQTLLATVLQLGFVEGIINVFVNIFTTLYDSTAAFFTDVIELDPVLLQLAVFAVLLGGVFALAALGLSMIFGVMDLINFAHGIFIVMGMYTVWYVSATFGISPFLVIPVAFALLFAIGVLVSVVSIEPIIEAPAENQFLATLGINFIFLALLQIMFVPRPRTVDVELGRINFFGASIPAAQLIALFLAIVTVIVVWLFLKRTVLGMAIRATEDNRDGAWHVGINVPRIDYFAFAFGSGLAGLAGAGIVLFSPFDPFISESYLLKSFVVVVLGGLGSFPGALVGGFIVGFIQVFGQFYLPGTTNELMIFSLFVLVLFVKPTGLFGDEEVEV
jgi:branched-chain amino acid transport system permease protein